MPSFLGSDCFRRSNRSTPKLPQASLRSRERFWDIPVPKIDSIFDSHYGPGRPASVALRYAPLVRSARQLPQVAQRRVRMLALFPLWRASARRVNSLASRLPGTTRLRFALHGGQRGSSPNSIGDHAAHPSAPALLQLLRPYDGGSAVRDTPLLSVCRPRSCGRHDSG